MPPFHSHTKAALSISERLALAFYFADSARVAIQTLISTTVVPHSKNGNGGRLSKGTKVYVSAMRHLLKVLPTKTLQAISPTSSETYKAWTKKRVPEDDSLEFAVDDLEWNGSGKARVLWLGKKPITMPRDRRGKVILYAHGGGFVLPLAKSHLEFLEWIREKVCVENGVIVSFALVEYTLAPECTYPTAFGQMAMALNHLLKTGIPPRDIILAGDSTGGQMTLSLLSHILHPHPDVPFVTALASPLAGAILVSPCVISATSAASMIANERTDLVTPRLVERWGGLAIGSSETFAQEVEAGRYHAEALRAPENWWDDLGLVVKMIGITGGRLEVFADDIAAFGTILHSVSDSKKTADRFNVDVLIAENEVHDGPVLADMFRQPSEVALKVAGWVVEAFLDMR